MAAAKPAEGGRVYVEADFVSVFDGLVEHRVPKAWLGTYLVPDSWTAKPVAEPVAEPAVPAE